LKIHRKLTSGYLLCDKATLNQILDVVALHMSYFVIYSQSVLSITAGVIFPVGPKFEDLRIDGYKLPLNPGTKVKFIE
jgi:hypothetical protein